jgi:hypothetical protein
LGARTQTGRLPSRSPIISAARGDTDRLPFPGPLNPSGDVRVMFTKI